MVFYSTETEDVITRVLQRICDWEIRSCVGRSMIPGSFQERAAGHPSNVRMALPSRKSGMLPPLARGWLWLLAPLVKIPAGSK